jgi:membrane peptidoglycan carboxypeptidase
MASLRPDTVVAAIRRSLLIIGVSGLAGVLVAGLALPVAASLGLAARESATAFNDMPAELETRPLAEQSRIVDATGKTLATFYEQNRIYMPLDQIAPVMKDAILAIEDHRFYEHGPIDIQGTARALLGNLDAGDITCDEGCTAGGGSTLTQQYVKLVLLDQAETPEERHAAITSTGAEGYVRKLRELRLAASVEDKMTKDEILERYLNIAYFGGGGGDGGAYGIEAAARYFFSTSAAKLTLPQAAMLAGLVQAPSAYDPTNNPEKAIGRRTQVLDRMVELGMVSEADGAAARQSDLGLELRPTPAGCVPSWAPWFCDYVVHELALMPELGDTRQARINSLLRGGLTVTTTLEPAYQQAGQEAVSDRVAPADSAVGTLAMVEPGTGYIRSIANSRQYGPSGEGRSQVNYAVDKLMGESNGIQAGSAFKPFVLAAAIRQGISLSTTINAPQTLPMGGEKFEICWNGNSIYTTDHDYSPKNSTGSGRYNLRTGTERSVNTFFVQLLQRTGICEPATIAQESGIFKQVPTESEGQPLDQVASFTLGSNTVSPLGMAEGYAMFAARGVHCDSIAVLQVRDRNGEVVVDRKPSCNRVLPEGVADGVNMVLQGVIESPGATGNRMRLDDGRTAAGKTGTTNNSIAVWFAGYTPQLATAVAVADLDGRQTTLDGRTYNGERISSACGGCIPGPIWKEAMDTALEGARMLAFHKPDPSVVRGLDERVPDVRGLDAEAASNRLADVGFDSFVAGDVASAIAQGLVVETDPASGSSVAAGSAVGLYISTGEPERRGGDDDDDDENGGGPGGGRPGGGPPDASPAPET